VKTQLRLCVLDACTVMYPVTNVCDGTQCRLTGGRNQDFVGSTIISARASTQAQGVSERVPSHFSHRSTVRCCRQHRPPGAGLDGLTFNLQHRLERLDTQTVKRSAHGFKQYWVLADTSARISHTVAVAANHCSVAALIRLRSPDHGCSSLQN